jgi:L-rhamnose mutarotase
MQTVTIELKNSNAYKTLHDLEEKDMIRIIKEKKYRSYALLGDPITDEEFREWVEESEKSPTISIEEAKQRWEQKKKMLLKNTD